MMEVALFSPLSLFREDDEDDSTVHPGKGTGEFEQNYAERRHTFPRTELVIREFSFHQFNANLLWPGTFAFAEWLSENNSLLANRRCVELGSGTGALAIFLRKSLDLDITTSDYNDQEIEDNIAYNCKLNGISPALPHIKHSWGETFPISEPHWDLIIASDILLYVKEHKNLLRTVCFLLKSYKPEEYQRASFSHGTQSTLPCPAFLMSWKRRIGKHDESLFFSACNDAGFTVAHLGARVYCITMLVR